jgi:hypothetical protein
MVMVCSLNWEDEYSYMQDFGENARRKRPPRRPQRRWVDDDKMVLRETGLEGMGWINLVQDRGQWRALVNTVMNLQVP